MSCPLRTGQSQGCLERFHQTFKTMLKKFCQEGDRDWNDKLDWLLFAIRECPQESTGFSPFELLFGRSVRGPLKMLKEKMLRPTPIPNITVAKYIDYLRNTLQTVRSLASKNLKQAQNNMVKHQKTSVPRSFSVGEKVLVFFPVPGNPLKNKYSGPYVITKKISPLNYIIQTPDRRKDSQLVHINLIKKYVERTSGDDSETKAVLNICVKEESMSPYLDGTERDEAEIPSHGNPTNSEVLQNLSQFLGIDPRDEVINLLQEFPSLTSDIPGSCNIIAHDIELIDPQQKTYQTSPLQVESS